MTVKSENDIETAVCRWAKQHGLLARKYTSPSHRAVPDRLFLGKNKAGQGQAVFVEFKRPGARPTPAQEREIARLKDAGQTVFWTDDIVKCKITLGAFFGID